MKLTTKLLQRMLLYLACFGVSSNQAKFVGNVKDGDDGGTITILDIQDDNKTQYLNQNFELGNYNYGYDIKPSGPVGQFHHENKAPDGIVYGCYGYEAPDTKNHMTFYISDAWGYRPVREEMDTEIFFPADNPGGGHHKGTMTRWADLFFPEMCAHFAERIASSTNVVTKAPIQVATPPASFSATKFEETSQPKTEQPLTGPPSPLSTGFGNKNTPVPSGTFDVVHLNKPSTSGPSSTSSLFGRLTSTNPIGTRQPITGSSTNLAPNVPQEPEQPSNNIIPNRFSNAPGGSTGPSSTPTGGSRPIGTGTAGLRTTTVPTNESEVEGSNVGALLPNTGATHGNRTPQSTRPASPTGQSSHNGQTPTSRPAPNSSRPVQNNNNANFEQPTTHRPLPGMPDSIDTVELPTGTSSLGKHGPGTGTSRLPLTQPASPTGSGQSTTTGLNFGDRTRPQGTSGQSTPTFGQTNPNGRLATSGRIPSSGSPTTIRFRSTTIAPIPTTTENGSSPGSTGDSGVPSLSNSEGSNSGLLNPTSQVTNGNDNQEPILSTRPSSSRPTQAPFRITVGTSIGSRVTSNPYNAPELDNDNIVGITSGNRTPSSPTGTGSRRPSGGLNTGAPEAGTTTGFGTTVPLTSGPGATRNPTGRPVTTNSRGTTGFSPSLPEIQGSTQGFSPSNQSTATPNFTGPSSPLTSQAANPPDSSRGTTDRRPTNVPSSSRFPSTGFSGNFNNPSTLQPSSTNQQTIPRGESNGNERTSNAPTSTVQRPASRLTTPFPQNESAPLIPQEPDLDTGLPHVSNQPEEIFTNGVGSNSPGLLTSNPAPATSSNDNDRVVTNDPFSRRPTTNPTFGSQTTFTPTRSPSFSPRAPTPIGSGTPGPLPLTGNPFRTDSDNFTNTPTTEDNDLFCASQCSSCRKDTPPPPASSPPRDEDFLNIPGAIMSQVPVIFYPDCSGNAYIRPAIVPFCPSSQPSPSQCNNGQQQQQPPTMRFPDVSNFIVGHAEAPVARNAFASAKKQGAPRVTRKVRRGHHQRRILST